MLPVVVNAFDGGTGGGDNNLTQTTKKVDGKGYRQRPHHELHLRFPQQQADHRRAFGLLQATAFYDNMNRVVEAPIATIHRARAARF